MNSRWFLVRGSTSKRVAMENEKLRALLKELIYDQDQGRNADNLLWLIKKLQRQQALGPHASRARSPSKEVVVVARAVEKYLTRCTSISRAGTGFSPSGGDHSSTPSSQTAPTCSCETAELMACGHCGSESWRSTVTILTEGERRKGATVELFCYGCGHHITFRIVQ